MTRTHRESKWKLDPHTKAKHEILRGYLGAWFPIMARHNRRLVFLDGFAGPGSYVGGEDGSPVVAIDTLLKHTHFERMRSTEFVFLFFEGYDDRHRDLETTLAEKFDQLPSNVKIMHGCLSFEEGSEQILSGLQGQMAPTLSFVDPFGVKGVPMSSIAALAEFDKAEVLINFMINPVKRFATAGNIDDSLESLYGSDIYLKSDGLEGEARENFLLEAYEQSLKEGSGILHTKNFSMYNIQNQKSYYLVHGTKHIKGLESMKDVMWKVDATGGSEFRDRAAGENVLFTEEPDYSLLRKLVAERFAGITAGITEVENWTTEHTPFLKTHLRKNVLKPMEKEGQLSVRNPKPKRRVGNYPVGTEIFFDEG